MFTCHGVFPVLTGPHLKRRELALCLCVTLPRDHGMDIHGMTSVLSARVRQQVAYPQDHLRVLLDWRPA